MVIRNQLGSLFKAYSADGGESWRLPQTTRLNIPEYCPYVADIPDSDKIMVIWNNSEYNPGFPQPLWQAQPFDSCK